MKFDALGVEIEGKRYAELLKLDKPGKSRLKLTTIEHPQQRAVIKLYFFHEQSLEPVKSIEIAHIPPELKHKTKIDLYGEYDGRFKVHLKIYLNDQLFTETDINLKRLMGRSDKIRYLAIAALLLGMAGIFFVAKELVIPLLFPKTSTSQLSRQDKGAVPAPQTEAAGTKQNSSGQTTGTTSALHATEKEKPPEPKDKSSETTELEQPPAATPTETASPAQDQPSPSQQPQKQLQTKETVVYFHPDDAALIPATKEKLKNLLPTLKEDPNAQVLIQGHCAPFGTEASMFELSQERAANVYAYLKSLGWNPPKKPTVEGQGGLYPVTEDPDQQDLNRRVIIKISAYF